MPPIKAHFDGRVFVPDEPVDLPAGQSATVHVTPGTGDREDPLTTEPTSLWDVLDQYTGSVEMPADWSAEHDHYLYGTPKRNSSPPTTGNGK